MKKWLSKKLSKRCQLFAGLLVLISITYYLTLYDTASLIGQKFYIFTRDIEKSLRASLKEDKGTGCMVPHLDPFSDEIMRFPTNFVQINCSGKDWVKCRFSECRVVPEILSTVSNIVCSYEDIIYHSDNRRWRGTATEVESSDVYVLTKSDHVVVTCKGWDSKLHEPLRWKGYSVGFRKLKPTSPPDDKSKPINVLILGFDSTAKNGFIRRMPKSYKFLTEEMKAVIMNGFNTVGDGTTAAMFPILTGKTELELPDVRKQAGLNGTLEEMPFIFYMLKKDGWRTAYFEDMPLTGTFQYRIIGFKNQPTDHYMQPFFMEEASDDRRGSQRTVDKYCVGDTPRFKVMLNVTDQEAINILQLAFLPNEEKNIDFDPLVQEKTLKRITRWRTAYFEDIPGTFQYRIIGFKNQPTDHYMRSFFLEEASDDRRRSQRLVDRYCVGDTPRFKLMLNVTDQFLQFPERKYAFTFIVNISHDNYNMISNADEDLVRFLEKFLEDKRNEDTLFILMGDHGPRYADMRKTIQGKLEERLPLMAILLPNKLLEKRPQALRYLKDNANVLTTPHDIYATVLDAIGKRSHWNPYKVEGADLKRGLTLLEPIPANRSCSEAGIEPHWCSCLSQENVSQSDPMYQKTARALVDYINSLTESVRSSCVKRELDTIEWVNVHKPRTRVLRFEEAGDPDGYLGRFKDYRQDTVSYQVRITTTPGKGAYEATLKYVIASGKFVIHSKDISRTNAYNDEPRCIIDTHPHLDKYCYCQK